MEKIALLPGGFKPPHAGHYNMAKWLAANTDADSVLIKVGSKEREGITRDISLQLWDLYRKADEDSNKLVIVPSEQNSPVKDVYDFIEQEAPENSTIYLGMGEKDEEDKRFKNIGKFAEPKGIEFKTVLVPPQAGGVSGTEMRGFIKDNDKENFQKYLPDHLNPEQKNKAWDIVSSLEEDFYSPENKTVDFMRSSEYKAGLPDGHKEDIPRKGATNAKRQFSKHAAISEQQKLNEVQMPTEWDCTETKCLDGNPSFSDVQQIWKYFYDNNMFSVGFWQYRFRYISETNGVCPAKDGGYWIYAPGIVIFEAIFPYQHYDLNSMFDQLINEFGVDCLGDGLDSDACLAAAEEAGSTFGFDYSYVGPCGPNSCPDICCDGDCSFCEETELIQVEYENDNVGADEYLNSTGALISGCRKKCENNGNEHIWDMPDHECHDYCACLCLENPDSPECSIPCYRCEGNSVVGLQFPRFDENLNYLGCPGPQGGWTPDWESLDCSPGCGETLTDMGELSVAGCPGAALEWFQDQIVNPTWSWMQQLEVPWDVEELCNQCQPGGYYSSAYWQAEYENDDYGYFVTAATTIGVGDFNMCCCCPDLDFTQGPSCEYLGLIDDNEALFPYNCEQAVEFMGCDAVYLGTPIYEICECSCQDYTPPEDDVEDDAENDDAITQDDPIRYVEPTLNKKKEKEKEKEKPKKPELVKPEPKKPEPEPEPEPELVKQDPRKEKELKEQQGGKVLRVYDFDDTLAITKGANIKIKHADGSMDILDPAEFATYEEQEGDKFDFTEFDRVIKDAEPIQNIISMLEKDLQTTAKVTILTARLIAYPVRRYLKTLNLDAYVVAVGSSDPMDKANWIKDHIEKGYNDILFIDDSEKNRNAVLSLKDEYPDIKLDVHDPANLSEMIGTMNNQEKAKHAKNLKRLNKDLKKQGDQYMEVPNYLKGTLKINKKLKETAGANINGDLIPLEIMDTPELQVTGMMGRDKLDGGMVFPYDNIDKREFHTQNCKIPLDIIFISNNKINNIHHNCPPCQEEKCPKYSGMADHVLELPGGYCEENNVQPNSEIGLNLTKPPKPLFMSETNVFTKGWWKSQIQQILTEGGAAGHMAHPFNLPNVNSGKELLDVFNKSSESLQNNPGSVKIDGVNSSIRLIDLDGEKQFVMDRGSKKELDIQGITKDDLEARFGEGHGMVKIGGEVLDMFNKALPSLKDDLDKLGAWNNPNILFNMEYVSGKTNVQDYGSNFIAIHGLNQIESKEVQGKRKMLIKRTSSEISYDPSALQSLLDNLAPIAKEQGFEVYGSVPTEMSKKPNFNSALSKNYTIISNEGEKTQTLNTWLNELNDIPEEDFIFMNVDNSKKKVGAVSKQVYTTLLDGGNIDELFEDENDKEKAIEGFTTYLATEKLGDEILKVLDSPMGSVENHEGVVIRDEKIANIPFKITGKFILGGMVSDF